MFFMGKEKKQPTKKSTPQNLTRNNLVSILDPGFPACIFDSQLSKRSTKTFSPRLPQLTGAAGNASFRSELHSCQALPLLCHPQLHCRVKGWCRRRTTHLGQSQILPNKATDNLDEFTQCEDLYKLLFAKELLFEKDQEGV